MKKISVTIVLCVLSLRTLSFQAVDLNEASVEQVALLPGIGKKLAHNIVKHRKQYGLFYGISDVRAVSGLTEAKIASCKDKVVFTKKTTVKKLEAPEKKLEPIFLPIKPIMPLMELEAKTLKAQGLSDDFETSLLYRARKAAYLPKLSTGVDAGHNVIMTDKGLNNSHDLRLTRGGRDVGFDVRLTFDLAKLIFNKDELEVAKLSLKRLEKREEIIARLHKYYFRYTHLIESQKKPVEAQDVSLRLRELSELEAELDTLSKGAFTFHQRRELNP